MKSKAQALYKAKMHNVRKSLKDKGYSTAKERTYFEYSHKDRKNIRDNAKPNSNARKYLGKGATLKEAFFQ